MAINGAASAGGFCQHRQQQHRLSACQRRQGCLPWLETGALARRNSIPVCSANCRQHRHRRTQAPQTQGIASTGDAPAPASSTPATSTQLARRNSFTGINTGHCNTGSADGFNTAGFNQVTLTRSLDAGSCNTGLANSGDVNTERSHHQLNYARVRWRVGGDQPNDPCRHADSVKLHVPVFLRYRSPARGTFTVHSFRFPEITGDIFLISIPFQCATPDLDCPSQYRHQPG